MWGSLLSISVFLMLSPPVTAVHAKPNDAERRGRSRFEHLQSRLVADAKEVM